MHTYNCKSDLGVQVIAEARERVRQYRKTWFDHGLRPGRTYEKLAKQLLPALHLSTRRENVFNLQLLLANLWVVKDRRSLLVPMHPTKWIRSRYRRTTAGMPRIIKRMLDAGYIDRKVMGRRAKEVSRIWCSPRLLELFSSLRLPACHPVELIVLKDANGRLQDYSETKHTRTLRKQLKGINQINGRAVIRFKSRPVQVKLHAVYNKDFTRGGRLYTSGPDHLQGFKGSERRRLTINGDPTVELDYSGYHPHLLYAREGMQFEGDPYGLGTVTEGPIAREFAKIAFQCLFNNKNRTEAERAANYWVFKNPRAVPALRPTLEALGLYPARRVVSRLASQHQPISHCFSASGLQLMNLDAKITISIVLHFTDQGIPCLPVHDSFIVQERYESELRRVMLVTYKEHTGGFTIPITKK